MFDKHYKGQGFVTCRDEVSELRSVRLSLFEIESLVELFPGMSLSFAIRSCIHFYFEYHDVLRGKK